jgi:hypothetical protein
MKRFLQRAIPPLIVAAIVICGGATAFASSAIDALHNGQPPVMPTASAVTPNTFTALPSLEATPTTDVTPETTPAPTETAPALYPIDVQGIEENGVRWIVKTYELAEGEPPEWIPTAGFEREGWRFDLTDIVKREPSSVDVREHVEAVTISTDTKNVNVIMNQLAPTLDYESADGYSGTLALDITTIKTETAGTKSSGYTVSATREYPHLSAADTSLIPKTITDGGRTLALQSVSWRAGGTVAVDYNELPESYTAVAEYSAAASRTVVTGYATTAEYSGTVAKVSQGRAVYTAVFIGSEITPERARLDFAEPTPEAPEIPAASTPEPTSGLKEAPAANPWDLALPVALAALFAGVAAGYFLKIKSNRKDDANETR